MPAWFSCPVRAWIWIEERSKISSHAFGTIALASQGLKLFVKWSAAGWRLSEASQVGHMSMYICAHAHAVAQHCSKRLTIPSADFCQEHVACRTTAAALLQVETHTLSWCLSRALYLSSIRMSAGLCGRPCKMYPVSMIPSPETCLDYPFAANGYALTPKPRHKLA